MSNSAQKKQFADAAQRELFDAIEKRIKEIVAKHRGVNIMADYGATEALVAVRELRRERGL